MIRINLLPFEDRPRPRNLPIPGRVSFVIYLAAFLIVAAGGYSYLQQRHTLGELAEKRIELAEEEQKLTRQTKAIEQLELQTALLAERLGVLHGLEDHRYDNVEWLNELNGVLPRRLWLKQLSRNQGGGRTTLEGLAEGYKPVSKLMKSLEESSYFDGVELVKAESGNLAGKNVIFFTLSASWGAVGANAETAAGEGDAEPAQAGKLKGKS